MERQTRHFVAAMLVIHGLAGATGCDNDKSTHPVSKADVATKSEDPGLLRTIMVQLGRDMNDVSRGLWLEDLSAVAMAATAIAEHPHVSDTERTRIQSVLGTRFDEFVGRDKRVHSAAVRLSAAATASDLSATLEELTLLQAACVTCHSDYREALR